MASTTTVRTAIRPAGTILVPFALTVWLSAFLLFQVQLVITKYVLPWFGGVAAVFTTCMLFFQVALLGGYLYSHLLMRRRPRTQRWIHAGLLLASVVVLGVLGTRWPAPITPAAWWKPGGSDAPVWHILVLLAASVGLPYFTLSTTGPLLQAWYAKAFPESSPYRWYALSNLGSVLGLITYPLVFEPLLTLRAQAWMWSAAYVVFAAGCGVIAVLSLRTVPAEMAPEAESVPVEDRITAVQRLLWFLLPACAALVLLAATNQVCQEVASVPFLWVLPLTLYLLSFIICFDHPRRYWRPLWTVVLAMATSAVCFSLYKSNLGMAPQIAVYATFVLAASMVCHGEVARLKPAPAHLTGFYLNIAAGGAAGGLFVGLLAPRLFTGYWEMYLGIWLVWLLLFAVLLRDKTSWVHAPPAWVPFAAFAAVAAGPLLAWSSQLRQNPEIIGVVLILLVGFIVLYRSGLANLPIRSLILIPLCLAGLGVVLIGHIKVMETATIARSRNFYGSMVVFQKDANDPPNAEIGLRHGLTTHGTQFTAPEKRNLPTTYYGLQSGVGLSLLNHPKRGGTLRVGVVGLGAGTLATYGRAGDCLRFYEINPEVLRLARTYFTFLKDTPAKVDVVMGDARLSLERELERGEPQHLDVLALDAFNSDSIPVHLLTREAFSIYLKHLDEHGIIAVHVSNRSLDLKPVVQAAAQQFGLAAKWIQDIHPGYNYISNWVLLSRDASVLAQPAIANAAQPFPRPPARLWTDDFSNLISVLK